MRLVDTLTGWVMVVSDYDSGYYITTGCSHGTGSFGCAMAARVGCSIIVQAVCPPPCRAGDAGAAQRGQNYARAVPVGSA